MKPFKTILLLACSAICALAEPQGTNLLQILERRDTDIVDLAKVGSGLVRKFGQTVALQAVQDAWKTFGVTDNIEKARDSVWLSSQPPRVRDVAWMLAHTNEWLNPPAPLPREQIGATPYPPNTNQPPAELESVRAAKEDAQKALARDTTMFLRGVQFCLVAQQRNLDNKDANSLANIAWNLYVQNEAQQTNKTK